MHDEIVVECDQVDADQVSAWLRAAMIDGMSDVVKRVPIEVELTTSRSWGGS